MGGRQTGGLGVSMTTTRWAEPQDVARLDSFLLAQADRAMFPLTNLRRYGVGGEGGERACRFLLTFDGPKLAGAVGIDQTGGLLPVGQPDIGVLRREVAGQPVPQILGETGLARQVQSTLSLGQASAQMNDDEPHFTLELARLIMPNTSGFSLVPLSLAPRELAIAWRAAYAEDVLGDRPAAAVERAVDEVESFLAADSHRVIFRNEAPVGMTGFNAELPEIVQVGAVFTPPALRGQGIARAAVALHLLEARARGVRRAVLFAASDHAARAYAAIGFERIGRYTIILFRSAPEVPSCP